MPKPNYIPVLPAPDTPAKLSSAEYMSESDNTHNDYPELINHPQNKYGRYYSEIPLSFD